MKYRLGRRLDKGRADLPIRDETPDPINSPLSFPPVFPLDRMFLSFFQSNVNRSFATLLSFFSIFSKIFNVIFEEVLISSARPSPRIPAASDRQSERFNRCSGWTTKSLDEERLYVEYVCSARLVSPGSELHAEGLVGRDSRPGTSFIFYPVESKRGGVCVCMRARVCGREE